MNSFKHAGDLGDLIYALPTIKALGGGVLYLNKWNRTRVLMSEAQIQFIKPLLECNEYDFIKAVEPYRGESVCYDLNEFREYWSKHAEFAVTIAEWHCRAFGVDPVVAGVSWLFTGQHKITPIVIHRSERYHNNEFPWKRIVQKYKSKLLFVGLRSEWQSFCKSFGTVNFHQVADALEMARIINGAKLFIGNQSLPNAIAEGLKVPKITEVFMVDPNCCFERPNAQYVFTRNVYLPEI